MSDRCQLAIDRKQLLVLSSGGGVDPSPRTSPQPSIHHTYHHFYRSAAAHHSTQITMDEDRCPVCAKLPLDGPPLGIEAPPFEYDLDHDQTEFVKYKGHCSVYRVVRDLHRIWLENGEGDGYKYFFSCGPRHYVVCTDPGKICLTS
jgi:hypothetical protein